MEVLMMVLFAFGGGIFGALVGALPAFIFTGFLAIAGNIAVISGGTVDILGTVAFGAFLGPHIAFGGGVAAAAFSANKKHELEAGPDILTPLAKFGDPMTLIVGGIFGSLAFLINMLYADILALPTDTVAMTVVTSGIIARFIFGKSGIIGDSSVADRKYFAQSKEFVFLLVMGLGLGLLVSHYTVATGLVTLGFGISAATLIFAQMGYPVPATHHISLTAAYAAAATGNVFIGALFGAIAAIFGDFILKTFNSHCDTHIDPPAFTIFVWAFIIFIFL
jgi:hypothetical protein